MKMLLDTNVILDTLQARQPFYKDAQDIFIGIANNHYSACITAKQVADIYYLMHRHTHDNDATREHLKSLLSIIDVIEVKETDVVLSLDSETSDFEDAMLVEAAVRNGIEYIVTRNVNDFKDSRIQAVTPSGFNSMFPL